VGSFEQALSALPHLPEQRHTREQAIDLRLALHNALLPSGDSGHILACLREAEALAVGLDDSRRLGQVSHFLSYHFYQRGTYDQAIAFGQHALALATASGDGVLQAMTNRTLGIAYQAQGDYRRAIDYGRPIMVSLSDGRSHERFGQVNLPTVISRADLAWCHAELGMFAEGRALGEEGLRIAEAADHPGSRMFAYYGIGLLFLRQGDLPRALPQLERAVGICQDVDLLGWFPRMAAALGAAYTLSGRVTDAVPLLTQAIEQATAMDRGNLQALCSLSLGEAHLLAGRLEDAHALAERALALTREHQERGHQAYALRLLGEVAVRHDPPERTLAEAHYREALALAEELGMRPLVAHCHRGLGTLYSRVERLEEARAALSTALHMYRTMEMSLWLPQAETTLAQIGERLQRQA
jgi:tetratricopeptide (TPR) repeat protein